MADAKTAVADTSAPREFQDLSMALFVNNFKRAGKKDPDYLLKTKVNKDDKKFLIVGSAWENLMPNGQKVISLRMNIQHLKEVIPAGA